MKTVLSLFWILMSSQFVSALSSKIEKPSIRPRQKALFFTYASNDETTNLDCAFSAITMTTDRYQVVCGKGTAVMKYFEVQFSVNQVQFEPRSPVFEISFVVIDHTVSGNGILVNVPSEKQQNGSKTWITLNRGAVAQISLEQAVENRAAALVVHYNAGL